MRANLEHLSADVQRNAGSLGMLLLLSGFFGAVFGATSATWQAPIETSQVLAGFVSYPKGSIGSAYHMGVISLVNYVGAFFLLLTRSEVASSILLSVSIGVISMQVVAMLVFLCARNVYLATLTALLVSVLHLHGSGISYPLILFGSPHGAGRAGMMVALLVVLLSGFSRWRPAFFLAGLSLLVHPTWGLWVNVCLVLAFALNHRKTRSLLTPGNLAFYATGVGISLVVAGIHMLVFRSSEDAPTASANARELFLHYIRYWDFHRAPFKNPAVLAREFLQVALAFGVALVLLNRSRLDTGVRVFATTILVAAVLGTVFVFVPSWLDPAPFPTALVVAMPSRFINFVLMVGFPLLLGLVLSRATSMRWLALIAAVWVGTTMLIGHLPWRLPLGDYQHSLLILGVVVGIWSWFDKRPVPDTLGYKTTAMLFSILMAVVLFTPLLARRSTDAVKQNFSRVDFPADFRGTVLTTMDRYLFQIESRLPIVSPNLDGYVYTGHSFEGVIPFYNDLFAIPFGKVPPDSILHGRSTNDLFAPAWELRECGDWAALAARFGFQAILVPRSINLRLKKVNRDPMWNVYYPRCPAAFS